MGSKFSQVKNTKGSLTPLFKGMIICFGAPGSSNAGKPVTINRERSDEEIQRKIDKRSWVVSDEKAPKSGVDPTVQVMSDAAVKAAQKATLIERAERAEKRAKRYRDAANG